MKTVLKRGAVIIALSAGFSLYGQQGAAPYANPFQNNAGQAATPQPAKATALDNLKAQYQFSVQAAVNPVRNSYMAGLQALVKTLTQNRDLDRAVVAQQELKNTQAAALPVFLSDVGEPGPAGGMIPQVDALRSGYRTLLRAAIKPIQDRYVQVLNSMLNTATQSGNLDDALAIRDELKRATGAQASGAAQAGTTGAGGANAAAGEGQPVADAGLGSNWYYMQHRNSDLYLRVLNGSHNPGARVVQDKKQGGQVWKFIPDGKGNYFIQSQASDLYLDAKFNGESQDQVERTAEMVWQIIPGGDGYYYIRSVATGNYLNTRDGNKDAGGAIDQGIKDESRQGWKLIKADNEL